MPLAVTKQVAGESLMLRLQRGGAKAGSFMVANGLVPGPETGVEGMFFLAVKSLTVM